MRAESESRIARERGSAREALVRLESARTATSEQATRRAAELGPERRPLVDTRAAVVEQLGARLADLLELRRVAGEYGTDPAARLGLPAGTPRPELPRRAVARLAHWSALTADPAFGGPDRRACQVLRRSHERLVGELAPS
ncbi:hypothetical protein [Kitasatospora sp. DSM 101779]|uniref:hypothetical protein n=1 Tax=Kitasatospora sp. DSM 101779 TaxID=2853165 RepID=UPI0021D9CFB4|nr:hypothetical protein [Kitasatospora sp. DSM 101779]MCU7820808.1 hypothetical protein [Kitasatospora sp. DSM 101779]